MKSITIIISLLVYLTLSASSDLDWSVQIEEFKKHEDWSQFRDVFKAAVSIPEPRGTLEWETQKVEKLTALVTIYGALVDAVDFDFNEKTDKAVSRVSPPKETGLSPGVSPELVDDPALKKEYMDAISDNAKLRKYRENQLMYRTFLTRVVAYIDSFTRRNFDEDDFDVADTIVEDVVGLSFKELVEAGASINFLKGLPR